MKTRSIIGAVAVSALLLAAGSAVMVGTSFTAKDELPTFPPTADDGRGLPPPPDSQRLGPAVPAPPTLSQGDLLEVARPAPATETRSGLDAYRTARGRALNALPEERFVLARITLRQSLAPADLLRLLSSKFTTSYVEYEIPGTDDHGGFPMWEFDQVVSQAPDLEIVHVEVVGRVSDLLTLAANPQVWLVDVGGSEDYFWVARATGALAD